MLLQGLCGVAFARLGTCIVVKMMQMVAPTGFARNRNASRIYSESRTLPEAWYKSTFAAFAVTWFMIFNNTLALRPPGSFKNCERIGTSGATQRAPCRKSLLQLSTQWK